MIHVLILMLVLIAAPAGATSFTLELTSGGGSFKTPFFDTATVHGATADGTTITAGGLAGPLPDRISGNAALTQLGGLGDVGVSSLCTPTKCYDYLTQFNFDPSRGFINTPSVVITDAGVPADGATHTVPFHIVIDVMGVRDTLTGGGGDSYEFFGDGLLTVNEFNQQLDGSYFWEATVVVTNPASVPEPATWALLGSGLAGLILWRKRTA